MSIRIVKEHQYTVNHRGTCTFDLLWWDVELVGETDQQLVRQDIWNSNVAHCPGRRLYTGGSQLLDHVIQTSTSSLVELIPLVLPHTLVKMRWYRDLQYYQDQLRPWAEIMVDSAGTAMNPHLDNSHIVVQLIVNLADNDSGTEIYSINSPDPIYKLTGEKNKGIMLFNSPGALHGINNVNRDRYILCAGLTI